MAETTPASASKPELKIGPFAGGIQITVWKNQVTTAAGPRFIRSIKIAPRRYKDAESGEWQDSPSYKTTDIPVLVLALQKAHEFVLSNPLPDPEDGPF